MKNRIRELREERNISQAELARVVGVVRSAMCQYENGSRQIPDSIKIQLADYFGVSIDYLIGRADDKQGVVLDGVYFRLASEAQEVGLPPEDIQKIIDLYKKYKKN